MSPERAYLSIKEAAEWLGVEYKTVYRLVRAGKLPAAKIGGVYRIEQPDLKQFVEQQKAQVAGMACSGCGRLYHSPASFVATCLVCHKPLCQACWNEGRNTCAVHTTPSAGRSEEATTAVRCTRCRRVIGRPEAAGGRCEEDGCTALLCPTCWNLPDGHRCPRHRTPAGEKLAGARERLARGEITRLVTGLVARQRELAFTGRFDHKIRQIATLRDPISGEIFKAPRWEQFHTAGDQQTEIMDILEVGFLDQATLERMPLNRWSRYQVPPAGRRQSRLLLEAACISHLEAHVRDSFDTQPAGVEDLVPLLEVRQQEAEDEEVAYFVGLASTTGWDEAARTYVKASSTGQSYHHRLLIPYLVDLHDGTVIYNELDERAGPLASLFAPQLHEEVVQRVVAFVHNALRVANVSSLTAAEVGRQMDVSEDVVREAFEQLAGDEALFVEEMPDLGPVVALR